jgi:maleamate amidohydrolase
MWRGRSPPRTATARDACGDRHPVPHETNLFDLQAKYAEAVSEAEVLALLAVL